MRVILLASALLCLTTPARAELVDARVSQDGGAGELWLAFDSQPSSAELILASEGAVLNIQGVESATRVIDVAVPSAILRIALAPQGQGVRVSLTGSLDAAEAELRQGGVLIRYQGVPIAAQPAPQPMAARADVPAAAAPREQREPEPAPVAAVPQDSAAPAALADDAPAGPCASTQTVIADSPWDLDALTAHADCLAGEGLTDQAIGLYERVLAFEPGHYAAAMGLGRLQAEGGSRETARELFLEAARNAQTDGEALQARAAARRLEDG